MSGIAAIVLSMGNQTAIVLNPSAGAQGPPGPAAAPGAAGQFYVTNAGATAPAWATISGDITASAVTVGQLTVAAIQSVVISGAAAAGKALVASSSSAATWTALAPAALSPGSADQLMDTNHAGTAGEWFTVGGDLTYASHSFTVAKVNGSTIPAGGALTTGNAPYVSGASALTYSALNLAGGAGWVTGVLPLANLTIGTAGQILTTNSGATAPAWASVGGDLTASTSTPGNLYVATLNGGTSAGPVTLTGTYLGLNGAGTYPTSGQIRVADGTDIMAAVTSGVTQGLLGYSAGTLVVGSNNAGNHYVSNLQFWSNSTMGLVVAGATATQFAATQIRAYGAATYPLTLDWSTSTAPTILSGTSATSLTVGTNKSAASLILQQDAGITAWTLSGGNALVMQAPSTATGVTVNWATGSGAAGVLAIVGQAYGGAPTGAGGALTLAGGAAVGVAQAGSVQVLTPVNLGELSYTPAAAAISFNASQSNFNVILLIGSYANPCTITLQRAIADKTMLLIKNTYGQTATISYLTGGTVTVATGTSAWICSDGTNLQKMMIGT